MPKFMNREQQSNGTGLLGATVLAIMPVFANFYVLLILSFVGAGDGKDRVENLLFAAASITWAYNPELAFNRLLLQMLVFIVVVVPFALPIRTEYTMQGIH